MNLPERLLQVYTRAMPEGMTCAECQRPFQWGDFVAVFPFRTRIVIVLQYICEPCLDKHIADDGWTPPAP